MRFLRRPRNSTPRPKQRRARPYGGRPRTLEVLEGRQLLAGDITSPWHNAINPKDVNFDQRVSAIDALIVINDLLAHGTRTLDAAAVSPLAATSSAPRYVDVSGDNRVSPLDLLIIVNELADTELMSVHTFPTDLAGNPISSISVGSQYKLQTDVRDIRDPVAMFPGVFSAAADVSFDSALSSIDVGQTMEFGSFFSLIRQSTLVPGRVIGYGSGQVAPNTTDTQFLWSVVLTATSPGTQVFTPAFSTDPNHENTVLGDIVPILLAADEIQYVGSTLQITGGAPTLFISNAAQAEDTAAPLNFTVTLSEPADENVTVGFVTSDGTGANPATTADNDYVATSGTLTFTPGQTMLVVPVTLVADTKFEADETFNVTLFGASVNATIGGALGIGTILNDEPAPPTISVGNASQNEDTPAPMNFTVTLSAAAAEDVTVGFMTNDGTGANPATTADNDYVAASGTLTFTPGQTMLVVPVTINADEVNEPNETFTVTLFGASANAEILNATGTGTIVNDDEAGPRVSVSGSTQLEGDSGEMSNFVFTVALSSATNQTAMVDFTTTDGTATAGNNDYLAQSGTLTFAPGQTVQTVTIQVAGDTAVEPSEAFFLNVAAVAGAGASGEAQGTGAIVDDDGQLTLTVGNATVSAGPNLTHAIFTVTLAGNFNFGSPPTPIQQVNVAFATQDNTALAGVDYLARTGNLTFNNGASRFQFIDVPVLAVSSGQPDKTFFVNLSSAVPPPEVVIDDDQGIGTIVSQGISISDATVVEGNAGTTSAVFTVTLSQPSDEQVTVVFSSADGTATVVDGDYQPVAGTLTFEPETTALLITVPVFGDENTEGNETFTINLSGAVGAALFNAVGTGTIINDDGTRVAMRLELADTSNTPLPLSSSLNVGDEFLLRMFVQDVQVDPQGIFGAHIDVMYESSLAMITGPATFGPFLTVGAGTSVPEENLLDDFGANATSLEPPENPSAEQLVFSLPLKATNVGLLEFLGSADMLDLQRELGIYVYGSDDPVDPSLVTIVNRSINIGTNVISVVGESQPESNNIVFTITRFLPSNNEATVVFTTADGSAVAPDDYVAQTGTLTFAAAPPGTGEQTQTVTVTVVDDLIDEPDETFSMVLSDAVGASASTLPGTATIENDDDLPSVSVGNASAVEGSNLVFTVSLSSVSGKTVTVAFATLESGGGNAATEDSDYAPVSGTLTFNPGITQQFVTVAALDDIELEPNESFQLVLSSPDNADLGATPGFGTIIDTPPAGIFGHVYVDLNDNGIKEFNESGIAGVIITATRTSDGNTQSTVTAEDGSYSFVGLFPGTYTIEETQPGFYTDGRDTRFGVESPVNDRFVGVSLVPSASETGFNFGERGVRAEFLTAFINRRALFATAAVEGTFGPTINMPGTTLNLRTGEIWVSFDGGWSGLRTIEALYDASQGSVSMRLYNNALQEVAVAGATATGSALIYNGQTGQPYFLRLSGSNQSVSVQISETELPSNLVAPSGDTSGESNGANHSPPDPLSPGGRFASAAPAAEPMIEPEIEPLASSDASDEALAEDEDWVLESLLA